MSAVRPEIRGQVVDYGCSNGEVIEHLSFDTYTGVDVSEESLAQARRDHPDCAFITIAEFETTDARFDTAMSLAVIGLLPDQEKFMRDMARVLKPGGRVVLTTPHPRVNWMHKLGGKLGLVGNDFGYDRDEQLPDRARLEALGAQAGLRLTGYLTFLAGINQLAIFER